MRRLLFLSLLIAGSAQAESSLGTSSKGGSLTASATIRFVVIIPEVVSLRSMNAQPGQYAAGTNSGELYLSQEGETSEQLVNGVDDEGVVRFEADGIFTVVSP